MTMRLAPRMNILASRAQSAFIKSRIIHDNFMFMRNYARKLQRTETPMLHLKLNIKKAFDSVKWNISWILWKKLASPHAKGIRWRPYTHFFVFDSSQWSPQKTLFYMWEAFGKEILCWRAQWCAFVWMGYSIHPYPSSAVVFSGTQAFIRIGNGSSGHFSLWTCLVALGVGPG